MWYSPHLPLWATELDGKDDRIQYHLSPPQERPINLTFEKGESIWDLSRMGRMGKTF